MSPCQVYTALGLLWAHTGGHEPCNPLVRSCDRVMASDGPAVWQGWPWTWRELPRHRDEQSQVSHLYEIGWDEPGRQAEIRGENCIEQADTRGGGHPT